MTSHMRAALIAAGLPVTPPRMSDWLTQSRPPRRRGWARFTDDEVLAIRREYEGGSAIVAIAERYGVHRMTVSKIVNYQTYAEEAA